LLAYWHVTGTSDVDRGPEITTKIFQKDAS